MYQGLERQLDAEQGQHATEEIAHGLKVHQQRGQIGPVGLGRHVWIQRNLSCHRSASAPLCHLEFSRTLSYLGDAGDDREAEHEQSRPHGAQGA